MFTIVNNKAAVYSFEMEMGEAAYEGRVVVMDADGEDRVTEMDVSMRDGSGTGMAKVEVTSRDESVMLVVISLAEVHGSSQHSGYRVRIEREEKVGELDSIATCET